MSQEQVRPEARDSFDLKEVVAVLRQILEVLREQVRSSDDVARALDNIDRKIGMR